MVEVKLKVNNSEDIPNYATNGSAGFDLYVSHSISSKCVLLPNERVMVSSGVSMEIPFGYEVQIRSRSGCVFNMGIAVAGGVSTIDSDYRGEVKLVLQNISDSPVTISPGERVAQGVLAKVELAKFKIVNELSDSARGLGGFGSTGV